jgi:hypothetical protein
MNATPPRWLAWIWTIGGIAGIILAIIGGALGYSFVTTSTSAATRSIDLGVDVLGSVADTAAILDGTFSDVSDSLRSVQLTLIDSAVTLTQVAKVTGDLGELVGRDIPDSIDAVRSTMPSLISTAGVVDATMRALSFIGVDYDREVPLDDALAALDQRLAAIPDDLRGQELVLDAVADQLSDFGGDTLVIGDDLADIRSRLTESDVLLDEYTAAADEASALLEELRQEIEWQGRTGRWIVVLLAVAVAMTQTLPIAIGWRVLSADPES